MPHLPIAEQLTSEQIVSLRPTVERPSPGPTPLDVLDEWEASNPTGNPVRVRTIFLRGSECRYHCVMCDLWKYTHPTATEPGHIAQQVASGVHAKASHAGSLDTRREAADESTGRTDDAFPAAQWVKLYNASSFFDTKNILAADLPSIAESVGQFQRVIVENHPRLLPWPTVLDFQSRLSGQLEIAMGLESIHPQVLPRLNKQMTPQHFANAARRCQEHGIDVRAFVLLRPPWMDEAESTDWCQRSIDFALENGVRHVSVIATRRGNGALEWLQQRGQFQTPLASSLEHIAHRYVDHPSGVIAVDLWDWNQLRGTCPLCQDARRLHLCDINLRRIDHARIVCEACNVSDR